MLFALAILVTTPKQLIALDEVSHETPSKSELIQKVYQYAALHKNSPRKIIDTINCENKEWDVDLQSRIINKKGIREDSWGLAQIHLPSHPNITKEQATDPDFALNYIAEHLGRDDNWSCYKRTP